MTLLTETNGLAACSPELWLLTVTCCKVRLSGDIFTSRLVLLVEQVKKKQRLLKMSFLSINGQFDSFFESKNHDLDVAEPSNYNR